MQADTNPVDVLAQTIVDAARVRGLPLRRVAVLAGVHVNTLRLFGKPGWNPAFSTMHKLAAALLMAAPGTPDSAANDTNSVTLSKHRNVALRKRRVG